MRKAVALLTILVMLLSGCAAEQDNKESVTPADTASVVMPDNTDKSNADIPDTEEELKLEPFDPLVYSGNGDKIITDVTLPRGVYTATISIDSTAHYDVVFHYGEEKELLVNNSGVPYIGTTLLKSRSLEEVTDGIFEITAEGDWEIVIEQLSGTSTLNIVGSGDQVTGIFDGTGGKEVMTIKIDSTAHYDVILYEYDLSADRLSADLLVNDSGEPYSGEQLAELEAGKQYFIGVISEGDWTIDFGTGDEITEYFPEESAESNIDNGAITDSISVEAAYNDMLSGSEYLSITNNGYEFKDYPISDSSVVKIGGDLVVNQGAMYEEIGAGLSLYCDFGLTQTLDESFFRVLIGTDSEPENWSELAQDLNAFILADGTDKEIITKLETLDCVNGTFDYEARKYEFVINNLDEAVSELHITNEMFGYVLAKLNEYPSEIVFDGNSVSVILEVKTYGQ